MFKKGDRVEVIKGKHKGTIGLFLGKIKLHVKIRYRLYAHITLTKAPWGIVVPLSDIKMVFPNSINFIKELANENIK